MCLYFKILSSINFFLIVINVKIFAHKLQKDLFTCKRKGRNKSK